MIATGGAVLSPFEPGREARPYQFLQRNVFVARLADAVVVIEAPARSGAINTAGWASGHIPTFAVPGDVDRPQVAGCLALIREGSTLARHAGDVLEALRVQVPLPGFESPQLPPDPIERAVLEAVGERTLSLEELALATGLSVAPLLVSLMSLELHGYIEPRGPGAYARKLRPS
jgi:DNA processing protein